jgi:hypothetical protein
MTTSPPTHRSVRKGSRLSVASTTARRSPSARTRPGAGLLPAWPPTARVLAGRRRAERFHVYGEEEFFADAGLTACEMEGAPDEATGLVDEAAPTQSAGRCDGTTVGRPGFLCGIVLAGVVLVAGLVLAIHTLTPARQLRRKVALRVNHAKAREIGLGAPGGYARGVPQTRPRQRRRPKQAAQPTSVGDLARPVASTSRGGRAGVSAGTPKRRPAPGSAPPVGPPTDSDALATDSPRRRDVRMVATGRRPASSSGQGEFGFER